MKLKDAIPNNYMDLASFTQALLRCDIQIPPSILFHHLSKQARDSMIRHYISHREDQLLPNDRFGDEQTVSNLLMFHSLWLGAGYPANDYYNV